MCKILSHLHVLCYLLDADLNILALSVITSEGVPRLAANLPKFLKNVVAVRFSTRSRCTARVEEHVYKHSHTFVVPVVSVAHTKKGPANQFR